MYSTDVACPVVLPDGSVQPRSSHSCAEPEQVAPECCEAKLLQGTRELEGSSIESFTFPLDVHIASELNVGGTKKKTGVESQKIR